MKSWPLGRYLVVFTALSIGCHATTRYQVLSVFFDGVPPPPPPTVETAQGEPGALPAHTTPSRQVGYREHGPYAAKLCDSCHIATAFNDLVVPREQLCLRCHNLGPEKKYVHGPLASGGCTACHDPHSSQYRYLLISESDTFCVHCHTPQAIARNPAHQGVGEGDCTTCHDAHMSDKKFLLR